MDRTVSSDFDVIVVGGGPAGSTAATFIAMQGSRVLLLEKHQLPTYKIGESLLPATVHGICPMLGVSEALREANFVPKLGGTFLWGRSKDPWTFAFSASSKMTKPTATAYQVERMKFDLILLNNARKHGVDVRERHTATGVLIENNRVVGLKFLDASGTPRESRCRYIVDASGHQSVLARYVGERVYSEFFQNIALFGYFRNGGRLPPPNHGNIYCVSFEHGWFWYIPLSATLTSVGVVFGKDLASKLTKGHELVLNEFIASCAPIHDLLASAERVTEGPYGELRVRKDYSYCHTNFWSPGIVLLGDAACFIDPVFSSGVHLATYSALLAARSINTLFKGTLSEPQCFAEFEKRYRREYANFYDFLIAFYDKGSDLDSYYWHARNILNSPEADNSAFIDLVAGMGGSREEVYVSTEEFFRKREGLGTMLFTQHSGDLHKDQEKEARRQDFYSELLGEIVQVQLQAKLKEKRGAELPLFAGGLVPTPDGLHWMAYGSGSDTSLRSSSVRK